MNEQRVEIELTKDLTETHFDLGWFPEQLPPHVAARSLGACVEFRAAGLEDDDDKYDQAVERLREEFCQLIPSIVSTLVMVEPVVSPPNRVRSYRGLAKKLGFPEGTDIEFSTSESETLLVGYVPVDATNCGRCFDMLLNERHSFILSGTPCDEAAALLAHPEAWCEIDNTATVDYMKLIPMTRKHDLGVLSARISNRGDFVSFRLFASADHCADVLRAARRRHG